MTKLDTDWYPEIIPGFDPVALKRKIREEIRKETEGMTDEEVCEHRRQASERFWAGVEHRRAELAANKQ
jgi:hypothetical protein